MFSNNLIVIVLASFNGDKFLSEQIASIQKQTVSNWLLLINDDSSTDNSVHIIQSFAESDQRIKDVSRSNNENVGVTENFGYLLKVAEQYNPEYVFFSDQDDIWLPNKIELFLELVSSKTLHSSSPFLVYSDMTVVDENLTMTSDSFYNLLKLDVKERACSKKLIFSNGIAGCSAMISQGLLKYVSPIPRKAALHDWYISIMASLVGQIYYINSPAMKYRVHEANTVGISSRFRHLVYMAISYLVSPEKQRAHLVQTLRQVEFIDYHLKNKLGEFHQLEPLIDIFKRGRLERIIFLSKNNYFPKNLVRLLPILYRNTITNRNQF